MNLPLDPTLWAAVLLGAASLGWTGTYLVAPWTARWDRTLASLPIVVGLKRFPLPRRTFPILVALFLLPPLVWMSHHFVASLATLLSISLALFLGRRLPTWRRARLEEEHQRRCLELFPQALEMTVQTLEVGQTLPPAIATLAKECPSPLREEFATVSLEMGLGASTEDALGKLSQRISHPDLHRFVDAYRLSRLSGANLARLYRVQLEGIEERHRLLRRLDSLTAQARLSGLLMGCLPLFLLLVLSVMDPELLQPLFTRPAGWAVLSLAMTLEILGFLWIKKLLNVEMAR